MNTTKRQHEDNAVERSKKQASRSDNAPAAPLDSFLPGFVETPIPSLPTTTVIATGHDEQQQQQPSAPSIEQQPTSAAAAQSSKSAEADAAEDDDDEEEQLAADDDIDALAAFDAASTSSSTSAHGTAQGDAPSADEDSAATRQARDKLRFLLGNLTEEQLDRYEVFRRSTFSKPGVKKLIQAVTGGTVSQSVTIAMSGMAKVFVGEVVEVALDVRDERHDSGALEPKHIREAVRRLKL